MGGCAVANCTNSQRNGSHSLHAFPKKNKNLAQEWLVKCKRQDFVNIRNARICSEHFTPEDFEVDFRAPLMGWNARKKLKQGSTPSQNLPSGRVEVLTERNQRAQKRRHDEAIKELISKCPWQGY